LSFFFLVSIIVLFLSLILLTCWIAFIICMLNHPCVPEMKPTWLWFMISLIYCWIWLARILLRLFLYLCSSRKLVCSFLFVLCPYLILVLRWYWLQEWVW
jgi:hypothetical protein